MSTVSDEAKEALLRAHLQTRYSCTIAGLRRLDRGVFDVQVRGGRHWVVRVFERRGLEQVEGDAALLRALQQRGFPTERCANGSPVSSLYGRSVLITDFVEGVPTDASEPALRRFGELLGRLHTIPCEDTGVTRPAGALHHYVPSGGGPREELAAAASWLDAVREELPVSGRALCDALRASLEHADACADLPAALIHPDPVLKNLLTTPTGDLLLIDWTGAGRGPRLISLAVGLWSCAFATGGWSPASVVAFADGYREYVRLEPEELRRLVDAMRLRPLTFACWRLRHAVKAGRVPDGSEWWWPSDPLADQVAAAARPALQG